MKAPSRWIWLSHVLDQDTPAYGDGPGLSLEPVKQIQCGDSCNTLQFSMSNHLGSHVDAPAHFVPNGLTIDSYAPSDWMFAKPLVIYLPVETAEIIDAALLANHIEQTNANDADLILFRTPMEQYRSETRYWEKAPGFSPDLCLFLQQRFSSLRAIGMNTISISSFQHRETGRAVHREFLGAGIRIFEDLMLDPIPTSARIRQVIAMPLRIKQADGAPTTLVAEIADAEVGAGADD